MGNDTSNPTGMQDAAARARQQQLQELQDISSDYLVQLESIIDSRAEMEDPRDVIAILKSNLRTAREQIERISSQAYDNNNDSPLPNDNNNNNINNNSSPISNNNNNHNNNNNKLQLAPTDSDSTNASFRSWLSKVGPLNGRIAYDWSNANIEQMNFDHAKMGKIHGISVATSTYDPVIMATVSNDGKLRIWKLRKKSNNYEIIHSEKKVHQIQLFETENFQLHTSLSHEIKEDDYIANISEDNYHRSSKDKTDSKRNSKRGSKKNSYKSRKGSRTSKKGSIDSKQNKSKNSVDSEQNFLYGSLGSNPNASYTDLKEGISKEKYLRKELRFELCHEIKLSSTWIMNVAIHHEGNLIAIGGLDSNVTIFDITKLNLNDVNSNNPHRLSNGFPNTNTSSIYNAKHKKNDESEPTTPTIDHKDNFEIDGKTLQLSELTLWEEIITCIEFLNDEEHIIVGCGDGTATICNYTTQTKIYCWKCDSSIISIDYLYLDPDDLKHMQSAYNRGKSPTIPRRSDNNHKYSSLSSPNGSPEKQKKKKKKWHQKRPRFHKMKSKRRSKKEKKEKDKSSQTEQIQNGLPLQPDFMDASSRSNSQKEVHFNGVPVVQSADFDDGSDTDSFGDDTSNMSQSPMHRSYDDDSRHIMIIIGSASKINNNVFIDEYSLGTKEALIKSMENKQKSSKSRCEQKDLVNDKVKFSISLEHKKCETVKFSPNGKYFAIGGEACLYQIYQRDTMKLIHQRYTKDNEDPIAIQRRPNLAAEYEKKKLKAIRDNTELDNDEETECFVTCLSWINDHTVAVGNNKGAFIYISTILHEYKIRNFVLKEWISMIDKHSKICSDDKSRMNADNLIEEIHEFIGCDVIDNVIETNFGDRTSCLTSHPYFEMKATDPNKIQNNSSIPNTPVSYGYSNGNRREGLLLSGSWSGVFQGCVLKG